MAEHGEARELELPYTARPQWTSLLLLIVLGVCVSLLAATGLQGSSGIVVRISFTVLLVFLWLLIVGLILWLGSYRIEIRPDRVRYARLGWAQEITYTEMRAVTMEQAVLTSRPNMRPARLLYLRGSENGRALVIGLRPFRDGDLIILLDAIEQLAPQAQMDASVQALRVVSRT